MYNPTFQRSPSSNLQHTGIRSITIYTNLIFNYFLIISVWTAIAKQFLQGVEKNASKGPKIYLADEILEVAYLELEYSNLESNIF